MGCVGLFSEECVPASLITFWKIGGVLRVWGIVDVMCVWGLVEGCKSDADGGRRGRGLVSKIGWHDSEMAGSQLAG